MSELEKELLLYKQDGMFALYFALNRKINELSNSLNSFSLDITNEDKTFDRFQKLTSNLKDMVESADWLRVNYLKMSETEAKEAEKSGVPLIEQLIANAPKSRK